MGFDNRFYLSAENELNRIRQRNKETAAMREAEAEKKCPELAKIQADLSSTASKLFDAIADRDGDISARLKSLEQENLGLQHRQKEILVTHGFPHDYLDPVFSCSICKDTGVVEGRRCRCFMDMVKKAAAAELNSSSPLNLCRFEDFDLRYYDDRNVAPEIGATPRKAMEYNLEHCKKYAEDFHLPYKGLLLRGKTGLGKTHLSLGIASVVMDKGYSVVYCSTPDILRRIENEHFGRTEHETSTLDMVIKADLLVLDDLGAEYDRSTFYTMAVYNILNDRMNASLPTIISTNLTRDELEKRYDERTFSRIYTMDELLFVGRDIRVIKANQQ